MNVNHQEISELTQYSQVFWRRRYDFLAAAGLVLLATGIYTLLQPKVYETSLLLLVSGQRKPQVVNADRGADSEMPKLEPEAIDTELQVLHTLPLISQAVDALENQYKDLDPHRIADQLNVKQMGKSGVASISYRDTDPERLVKVLNQLGRTYVNFSLTNRRSQVTSAIQFIEKKLPSAQKNLTDRSRQLAVFRRQYNLVNPSDVGGALTKALADIDDQERATVTSLRQGLALYRTLASRLDLPTPKRALAIAALSQDPGYVDLLKDYQEAEKQYRIEQLRFTEKAPQTQLLKAKMNRIGKLLVSKVRQSLGQNFQLAGSSRLTELQVTQVGQLLGAENDLRVQQARLAALQAARRQLERQFKVVPDLQRRYDDLSRQVQISSENVTRLLSKLEDFRIVEAQEAPTWKVIQPPYLPERPVSPNILLNLMVGSVLAVMVGGLIVYVREQLDKRLHSIATVNQFLPLRTLTVIPVTDDSLLYLNAFSSGSLVELSEAKSELRLQWRYFQAAIQNLMFNLRSSGVTDSIKAIGLTSSTTSEGKSVIVRHLGICAAELGYRVLLIDGDLRKPSLHEEFNLPNNHGLSGVLRGVLPYPEAIQLTPVKGLSLLTAGMAPTNPMALLDSARMARLMPQLREQYDLILMDLPPVTGLTDALAAANHLDSLVFVVGLHRATRETLNFSVESLQYARSKPIGVVFNMAEASEITHSAYLRGDPAVAKARL